MEGTGWFSYRDVCWVIDVQQKTIYSTSVWFLPLFYIVSQVEIQNSNLFEKESTLKTRLIGDKEVEQVKKDISCQEGSVSKLWSGRYY